MCLLEVLNAKRRERSLFLGWLIEIHQENTNKTRHHITENQKKKKKFAKNLYHATRFSSVSSLVLLLFAQPSERGEKKKIVQRGKQPSTRKSMGISQFVSTICHGKEQKHYSKHILRLRLALLLRSFIFQKGLFSPPSQSQPRDKSIYKCFCSLQHSDSDRKTVLNPSKLMNAFPYEKNS